MHTSTSRDERYTAGTDSNSCTFVLVHVNNICFVYFIKFCFFTEYSHSENAA